MKMNVALNFQTGRTCKSGAKFRMIKFQVNLTDSSMWSELNWCLGMSI